MKRLKILLDLLFLVGWRQSMERRLTVRLRARRINRKLESRLREKYMENLEPTEDNEQQADLCTQFEMRRRRITAEDRKRVLRAKKLKGDWERLEERLESTRTQRILGWEMDQ